MDDPGYRIRGGRLRHIRKRRRMTQADLARLSGVSVTQISRIESELHVPHFSTIERLGGALSVDPDELIEWELAPV